LSLLRAAETDIGPFADGSQPLIAIVWRVEGM
jgi:hypothetical protein